MRVRDHIAVSTAGAALLAPWLRREAVGVWAGGVLVDADHYLWFGLRERRWSPRDAMRFFNEADPPQHGATRVFHSRMAPLVLLALGTRQRMLGAIALGMAAHIALDACHEARMDAARARALRRDDFECQNCSERGAAVGTHLRSQPWLLPSYQPANLVALCDACHEREHARWS